MSFQITHSRTDDRLPVERLTDALQGILIGDKGYISRSLKKNLKKKD